LTASVTTSLQRARLKAHLDHRRIYDPSESKHTSSEVLAVGFQEQISGEHGVED